MGNEAEFKEDAIGAVGKTIWFISKVFISLLILVVLSILVEIAINLYDLSIDRRTSARGVSTAYVPAHGNTLEIEHKMDFRSSDFSISLKATHLTRAETVRLESGINGVITAKCFDAKGNQQYSSTIPIVLKAASPVRIPSVEMSEIGANKSIGVEIGVRYNVSCYIDPFDSMAEQSFSDFASMEFLRGERLEFIAEFDSQLPTSMTARLDFSKRPRSILYGTKLYKIPALILGK